MRRPTQQQTTRSRQRPPRRRTPARTPGDAIDRHRRPGQTQPADATRARPEAQPANHGKPPDTETKPETEPRHTPHKSRETRPGNQPRPPKRGATPPRHAHGDEHSAATATRARPRRAQGCARPPSAGTESPRRLAPGDGTRDNLRAAAGGCARRRHPGRNDEGVGAGC